MGELKLWEFSVRFQNRYVQLDPFQQDAVKSALLLMRCARRERPTSHYTWGPPGTGKTHTAMVMVLGLLEDQKVVFATADGIMAVIELAERLKEYVDGSSAPTSTGTSKREWVIVTSHADQVLANKPDLCDLHLHTRARKLHEHLSTIHYTDVAAETKAESQTYLKRFLPPSLLGLLTVEKGGTFSYDLPSQAQLKKAILNEAKLVVCTISEAGQPWMQAKLKKVDAIVCDEAAHIPSAMFSILLTSGAPFMAQLGDKQQAIAEVHSAAAQARNYSMSVFESHSGGCLTTMLTSQWRCSPEIVAFFSREFYDGKLVASRAESVVDTMVYGCLPPICYLDLDGTAELDKTTRGYKNNTQARACTEVLATLDEHLQQYADSAPRPVRVVVLTPYVAQVELITEMLKSAHKKFCPAMQVAVCTVDMYQGREADVVVLVTVRDNPGWTGFCADSRWLNVAVSRAGSALVIVSSRRAFQDYPVWERLYQHCCDIRPSRCGNLNQPEAAAQSEGMGEDHDRDQSGDADTGQSDQAGNFDTNNGGSAAMDVVSEEVDPRLSNLASRLNGMPRKSGKRGSRGGVKGRLKLTQPHPAAARRAALLQNSRVASLSYVSRSGSVHREERRASSGFNSSFIDPRHCSSGRRDDRSRSRSRERVDPSDARDGSEYQEQWRHSSGQVAPQYRNPVRYDGRSQSDLYRRNDDRPSDRVRERSTSYSYFPETLDRPTPYSNRDYGESRGGNRRATPQAALEEGEEYCDTP
jgi:hypothetical protein